MTEGYKRLTLNDKVPTSMGMIAWSPTLKHSDIQITGNVAKRVEQTTNNFVGIFGNRVINMAPPFIHTWIIKVKAITQEINIGVC
jgi:hypothetical protein